MQRNKLSYFATFIKPYSGVYILLLGMFIVINIFSLATPYALKIIIDDVFIGGAYSDLIIILGILVVVYILRISLSFYSNIISVKLSRKIVSRLRNDLYGKILESDTEEFKNRKAGDLIFHLTSDVEKVQNLLSVVVMNVINNLLLVCFIVGLLLFLNTTLALITLAVVPFVLLNTKVLKGRIKDSFQSFLHIDNDIYNFLIEKLQNIRVIKSFNTYERELKESKILHTKWTQAAVTNTYWGSLSANITTFLIALTPVLLLLYGGSLIFQDLLTIGTLIAFIQYSNKLFAPVISLANSYNEFVQADISMERLHGFVSKSDNHCEDPNVHINSLERLTFQKICVIKNSKTILSDLSLDFESGKTYGIMGASGSGKSTIVNLILRFISPVEGEIMVNKHYPLASVINLYDHIVIIEKENQIFSNTLEYNIAYGASSFDTDTYKKSLKLAGLESISKNLEETGSTYITSSGSQLSDGEKQRISIARAVYKSLMDRPSMIIFDESTSSLDENLEEKILLGLKRAFTNSIFIIISHRNSIKKLCDVNLTLSQDEDYSKLLVVS
jgi:ABC-type bacteriocin/lantibiotic exporter with double-glycine peptidase domain